jgi:drug/metabolite transporter (DMT)-like permease
MTTLKPLSNQQRGIVYAIASGVCYGPLGYFGLSIVNADLSVATTAFWRFVVSSVALCCIMTSQFSAIRNNAVEALKLFLCGIFLYYPGSVAYLAASRYIGSGLAIVIFFTFPMIVILINRFFYKTQICKMYYLSMMLIIPGLILLVDTHHFDTNIAGLGLSFLSSITYAFYVVLSKRTPIPPLPATFMLSIGCVFAGLLHITAYKCFVLPSTAAIWLNVLGIGIICTAIPILLLLQSLKYISSEQVSILSVLEPIAITLVGVTILDETITALQICGIVIILAGAMITLWPQKQ